MSFLNKFYNCGALDRDAFYSSEIKILFLMSNFFNNRFGLIAEQGYVKKMYKKCLTDDREMQN